MEGEIAAREVVYLRPDEWRVLVDFNPIPEAAVLINSIRPDKNRFSFLFSIGYVASLVHMCIDAVGCMWMEIIRVWRDKRPHLGRGFDS
jgi:hypothetical protein